MGARTRLTISILTMSVMLIGLASIAEARRGGRGPDPQTLVGVQLLTAV